MAGWRSELAGCRSTLSMLKIKVRISETKYRSFFKTLIELKSSLFKIRYDIGNCLFEAAYDEVLDKCKCTPYYHWGVVDLPTILKERPFCKVIFQRNMIFQMYIKYSNSKTKVSNKDKCTNNTIQLHNIIGIGNQMGIPIHSF